MPNGNDFRREYRLFHVGGILTKKKRPEAFSQLAYPWPIYRPNELHSCNKFNKGCQQRIVYKPKV